MLPRNVNAALGGLLVAVMLGSSPTTAAYLTTTLSDASNVIGTAKQFTISDLTAIARPAGAVQLAWSAASWAGGGYSIRRATTPSGPFSEVTVVPAGATTYTDTSTVDATTYSYEVFGLSGSGGIGTGSTVANATADATAPRVSATTPAAESTNVGLNTSVSATFSEAMNQSLTAASIALVDCGATEACASPTTITSTQDWAGASSVTVTPVANLSSNEWYALSVATTATDVSGNALTCGGANPCYWHFQTGASNGAPGLASMVPADSASQVGTNTGISLQWTQGLSAQAQADAQNGFALEQVSGAGAPCYVYSGTGQTPACAQHGGTWSNPFSDGSEFIPTAALLASTTYTATESANDPGVLGASATATWTTASAGDSTAPAVTRVAPANGASGISPSTSVQVSFSKAMDVTQTSHAFQLQAWSNTGACTGSLGSAVAGSVDWSSPTQLSFYPAAVLTASTCYQVNVATTAADTSGNALAAWGGADFAVVAGAPPTVSLPNGSYYYPGATISASGAGWSLGTGNVLPQWDDGTALDAAGAALTSSAFSGYTFSLPTSASAGSHTLWFERAGGASVGVPITVQSPSRISLSASSTDISAGGSSTITATVYDQGQPAADAAMLFDITTDAGSRGSFSSGGSLTSLVEQTNAQGQPSPVTLYVSSGGSFSPITITATSGSATQTITIIDPAPLPPQAVQLAASTVLQVSWEASPSPNVADYIVSIGTASGAYTQGVHTGLVTTYTFAEAVSGTTYYVVVRAADAHGALSDPTPEVHVTVPLATPTAMATASPTVTATATALPSSTATPTAAPTHTPTVPPTHTPTTVPTATATLAATVTPTASITATAASTATATPTATAAATVTATPTATGTATATPTSLPTSTATATPAPTHTAVPTATATATLGH